MTCPICGVALENHLASADHMIAAHATKGLYASGGMRLFWLVNESESAVFKRAWSSAYVECFCGWRLHNSGTAAERHRQKLARHFAHYGGLEKHYDKIATQVAWKILTGEQ